MKCWLINHSWDSFRRTREYCGFISPTEQQRIKVSDGVVYFGQGLVFGIFEAIALVENEFKGWAKPYPFQVKLKQIVIAEKGLIAKPLESKILLQKSAGGSPNILELNEKEFNQILKAIKENKKQLTFE